jgi:hypothetical protein
MTWPSRTRKPWGCSSQLSLKIGSTTISWLRSTRKRRASARYCRAGPMASRIGMGSSPQSSKQRITHHFGNSTCLLTLPRNFQNLGKACVAIPASGHDGSVTIYDVHEELAELFVPIDFGGFGFSEIWLMDDGPKYTSRRDPRAPADFCCFDDITSPTTEFSADFVINSREDNKVILVEVYRPRVSQPPLWC